MYVSTSNDITDSTGIEWDKVTCQLLTVLDEMGYDGEDIDFILVSDEYIKPLNKKYNMRPGSTDVLTFNLSDEFDPPGSISGEIYISIESAKKNALEYNVPFKEEIIRLAVHGILHLTGMTHDEKDNAQRMEEKTEEIIERLKNSDSF